MLGLTAILVIGLSLLYVRALPPEDAAAGRALLVAIPLTLLGLVTMAWVRLRHGAVGQLFGPRPWGAADWLAGVRWGVGAFVLFNVAIGLTIQLIARQLDAEVPQPQEVLHQMATDPVAIPWLLLAAVVVAPISEELYFRGMLFQALRRRLPAGLAIGASATVFAAAHFLAEPTGVAGLLVFALILPLGVLLAWLLERRGTLVAPIVAHAVFNFMTLLILVAGGSASMGACG